MLLPYALSISHFVSSVGADAGFAALLGLAILVLLYFAHARETSTLRNQLAAAMRRLEELELRIVAAPTPPVAPKPPVSPHAVAGASGASATSSSGPPVAPRPASLPPLAAPAGVAAPALSDATRVVPSSPQPALDREVSPADGRRQGTTIPAAPLGAPQGTGVAATALSQAPSSVSEASGPPGVGRTPSPVTAAGGGNGSATRAGLEGPIAARSLLEHGIPGQKKTARWLVSLLAVVVVAAIAVVLVLVLTGGHANHRVVRRHHPQIAAAPRGVVPSAVMVAVVNGTSVNQLAHHIGDRLVSRGFKEGTLATASDESLTRTTVGFLPGHRKDALAVAHALRLPAGAVRAASGNTEGLICPVLSTCLADVIVAAGSDLAATR